MKLIENWMQHLWRAWSIRLAAVAGIVAAYLAAYPDELQKLIAIVPEQYRPIASLAIGVFVFASATGARLVRQGGEAPQ